MAKRYLLLVLMLTAAYLPAEASVTEQISFERYPLKKAIRSSEFIKSTLDRSTPIHIGSVPHHSTINWSIKSYPDDCAKTIRFVLDAKVILPASTGGTKAYKDQLLKYVAALETHEQGAIEILRKAAASADRGALADIPFGWSCKQRITYANKRITLAIEAARSDLLDYNLKTQFGRQQGALLTPVLAKQPAAPRCKTTYDKLRESIINQLAPDI